MKNRTRIITAAIVAATLGAVSAQAANWTGAGGDGLWVTPANWDGGVLPTGNDTASIATNLTVVFEDGNTNSFGRQFVNGGATFNLTGGKFSPQQPGNTVRDLIGDGSGQTGTVNQTSGYYGVGHLVAVGKSGGTGFYNLSGGTLNIGRGGNTLTGSPYGASLSVGGNGSIMHITGGTINTRVGVEIDTNAKLKLDGTNATFTVGNAGSGDGTWYQEGTLDLGISSNGITKILIDDPEDDGTSRAIFAFGSLLDVELLDGWVPTGTQTWDVITCEGLMLNNGMKWADAALTNNWSFKVVSNNTLQVTYGIGSSMPPTVTGRNMRWNGTALDNDFSNTDNWGVFYDGNYNNPATWPPYNKDNWTIGEYHNAPINPVPALNYYGGAAEAQNYLNIGNRRDATFNMYAGKLSFGAQNWHTWGNGNAGGNATVYVADGATLDVNAIRAALDNADATITLDGGSMSAFRARTLNGASISLAMGYGGSGTGLFQIKSTGTFTSRAGVSLGNTAGTATGIFSVEGSDVTQIGIGSSGSLDGVWIQYSNSVLRARIDATTNGVTPIFIDNVDNDGDCFATFENGAQLDLGFMAGVTNYGSFDLMIAETNITDNGITFAPGVDTAVWSYEIVANGVSNILRVTATEPAGGYTSNGTPYSWLNGYYDVGAEFGGDYEAADAADTDMDGLNAWEEYVAGTIPTDNTSVLAITSGEKLPSGDFIVTWQSRDDRWYSVITNLNLTVGTPGVEASGIQGKAGSTSTSYTSSVPPSVDALFVEIGVTNAP